MFFVEHPCTTCCSCLALPCRQRGACRKIVAANNCCGHVIPHAQVLLSDAPLHCLQAILSCCCAQEVANVEQADGQLPQDGKQAVQTEQEDSSEKECEHINTAPQGHECSCGCCFCATAVHLHRSSLACILDAPPALMLATTAAPTGSAPPVVLHWQWWPGLSLMTLGLAGYHSCSHLAAACCNHTVVAGPSVA